MDPLLQQVVGGIVTSGPVASVLLIMWYYQRKDAKAEQDRHAVEEQRWQDKYIALVDKLVSALEGKEHA